jgi:predicted Zn-dependent protease
MNIKTVFVLFISIAFMSCTKSIVFNEELHKNNFHRQKVGKSSRDLLACDKYGALKIEVQYMPGFKPDEEAILNLKNFLYDHLHKPDGITIEMKQIKASKDSILSLNDIVAIETASRKKFTTAKEIAVYVLYTNGLFIDDKMLGYAYLNTSVVVFGKNVWENSNAYKKPGRSHLETKILQHEIGHLLGLVNVDAPPQAKGKKDRGKHCSNKQCLMYHLIDTEAPPGVLFKKELPKLGKECLQDLVAYGGQ